MKSILIIFFAFVSFTSFYSNNGKQNNYNQNLDTRDAASENFISQDFLSNSITHHKLNHSKNFFLRIEIILNDDYSKDNCQSSPLKISADKYRISYNHKNFCQLNIFLPFFTQDQKSIQSEFLLI